MRIHLSDFSLTLDRIRSLPTTEAAASWDGARLPAPFYWSLSKDPVSLWFRAVVPGAPAFDERRKRGEFIEGLWEQDVAEFFVMDADGRYLEFNLSPAGAWWSCLFQGYRQRSMSTRRPETVCIETQVRSDGWEVIFAVATDELSVPLSPTSTVHVAAIVHGPPQRFISSNPVPDREPDFHLADCFRGVELVPLGLR